MADDDTLEDCWKDLRPTIGTLYDPAMGAQTEAEAKVIFERLVARAEAQGLTREDAEKRERTSIGYYAGYHNTEVQGRVERLFGAVHPVFGSVSNPKQLTPEETLQAGMRIGERLKKRRDSPIFCEHANECPNICPCDDLCYCKDHTCRDRPV